MVGPPGAPDGYDPERGVVPFLRLRYRAKGGVKGLTRKFWAEDSEGRRWKVKYRSRERLTEIAATRILWRMGYAADHVYPVDELLCEGCLDEDPWHSMDRGAAPPAEGKLVVFYDVSIERSLQHFLPGGHKIESFDGQGVSLDEVDELIERLGDEEPTRAAELESLKVVAFMLQHSDSKAANQRLVGMRWPDRVAGDGPFNQVAIQLQDLGSTFGRGRAALIVSKLSFGGWKQRMEEPWQSDRELTLRLPLGLHAEGGWRNPTVSEAGLRFFLERSRRLSHQDLVKIFEMARFPQQSDIPAEVWAQTWEGGIRLLSERLGPR